LINKGILSIIERMPFCFLLQFRFNPILREGKLARSNYQFKKRQKELARKKKRDEKMQRKIEKKTVESEKGEEEGSSPA